MKRLSLEVQGDSERSAQNPIQNRTLLQTIIENQHIIQALRNFQLRRENEIREEKLHSSAIFHLEIGGRNFNQTRRLARSGIARYVERVFHATNDEKTKIMIRR